MYFKTHLETNSKGKWSFVKVKGEGTGTVTILPLYMFGLHAHIYIYVGVWAHVQGARMCVCTERTMVDVMNESPAEEAVSAKTEWLVERQ